MSVCPGCGRCSECGGYPPARPQPTPYPWFGPWPQVPTSQPIWISPWTTTGGTGGWVPPTTTISYHNFGGAL